MEVVGGHARSFTSAAVLLDTNVLIYAVDSAEPEKSVQARRILDSLESSGVASLCAQVLGEYCSVVLRKFQHLIPPESVVPQAEAWARAFPVRNTTTRVVLEALRATIRYQMPYYDAQIWAVARVHRIPLVLSEDFADGAVIEGVRFANPFAEGFDLEAALVV
ncbi:MAG: PIN domain-containing protein [Coriobacteriia bacterium]|nr:PIN domain-containing protein [Coriobacteriia bacterium]MBN2847263.1 PIN domain-containing protein [Coriobacteriia bacterium]